MCWACWCTRQWRPLDLGQGHEDSPEPSHGGVPASPKPSCGGVPASGEQSRGGVEARASPLTAASQASPGLGKPSRDGISGSGKPSRGGISASSGQSRGSVEARAALYTLSPTGPYIRSTSNSSSALLIPLPIPREGCGSTTASCPARPTAPPNLPQPHPLKRGQAEPALRSVTTAVPSSSSTFTSVGPRVLMVRPSIPARQARYSLTCP